MTLSESRGPVALDLGQLAEALENANISVLAVVTYQLTGDRRWVSDAYRPTRAKGMDENRSGGLSEATQAEIRRGAHEAIAAWAGGVEIALPHVKGEDLVELLSFMNGEEVPPEYEAMMSELLGFAPAQSDENIDTSALSVLVIGAGVFGLLASMRLDEAGIRHVVVEKNSEVGGGWWENSYPGAGVDTNSHLYSYSFFERDWSTFFGKRDEVHTYLADFADHFELRRNIQFDSEVTSLEFDEKTSTWTAQVRRSTGEVDKIVATAVITAVGVLNRPKLPKVDGLETFQGEIFHTARWPEGLDLTGKRVALVGAGASAMQVGPAISDKVGSLTVFQRSTQWIAPNADYFAPVDESLHWLGKNVPFYSKWYRAKLSWIFNDRVHPTLKVDPDWPDGRGSVNAVNDGHRRFYERYMADELGDRQDLIEKLTPDYPPFGKRMLLDNGWYRMLRRNNSELVTEGVASLDATGLTDSAGTRREFDVVILATGFESTRYLFPMEITGRDGVSLSEVWKGTDARAYLGMTVPTMPNLFVTFGPNSGLGHGGSMITIAEWQVRYIVTALKHLAATGAKSVECRSEVYDAYGEAVDRAHDELVWTDKRMTNWYRNEAGRVVVVMPWRIVDYYSMTRHLNIEDFVWR